MIFVTGDTHGLLDLDKIEECFYGFDDEYTKKDYLIILGDVACCWDGGDEDRDVRKALHDLPLTVLWIDGNHENFDIIDKLTVTDDWNGGKVQFVDEDIIHLMRGQVYMIEGREFFTFGGANSIDKNYRIEGQSWWAREMPSDDEYDEGIRNLKKAGGRVDCILTHTCPGKIAHQLTDRYYSGEEELQRYLDEIAEMTEFREWYFGHWHVDENIGRFHALYNDVIQII
jgi:hypothetical protein